MRSYSFLLGGLLLAGCGGSAGPAAPSPEESLTTGLTYEQFKASLYQEPDTGLYLVEGDIPIQGEEKLREYYARNVQPGGLIIHQTGGGDTAWNGVQANNLTYCVSTSLSHHAKVVEAMQRAALFWEAEAYVAFRHDFGQDGNCNASNNTVIFDVRVAPSNAPYDARAFFPNESRSNRNILIHPNVVAQDSVDQLTGALTHELGHTLGFRHEHTRYPGSPCAETNDWRALTPFDSTSIMYYNFCPGFTGLWPILSGWDKWGVADKYKRGPQVVAGDFDGNGLDDVLGYHPGNGQAWVGFSNTLGSWSRSTSIMSAGFDFWNGNDRVVVLDFNNDGRDDLFVYRPGGGPAYAIRGNADRTFTTTTATSSFAGFNFSGPHDRAVAFDYDTDGFKDLFFYRPGGGVAWVARSNGDGTFSQAFASTSGIAGYALQDTRDQVRVLDSNNDGRDDLFFFRPGGNFAGLIRNTTTGFTGNQSLGFMGFDFMDGNDDVVVLDFNGDNRDDLLMYRPGHGVAYLARSLATGGYSLQSGSSSGIGGYDLLDRWDRAVKLDFNNDGFDDLFFHRRGSQAAYMLQSNGAGGFSIAYGGLGIGGTWAYDFTQHQDKAVVLDHDNDQRDDVYLYRADSFRQVQSMANGQFLSFFPDAAIAPW